MVLLPRATILRPHGLITIEDDSGRIQEFDLLTCAHCQYTWAVIPGSGRKRGWCLKCQGPTCGRAACRTCIDVRVALDYGVAVP